MAACHARSPRPFLEAAAEKRAPRTAHLRPLISGPSDAEPASLGPGRAREAAPASRRDRESPEGDRRAAPARLAPSSRNGGIDGFGAWGTVRGRPRPAA